MKQDIDSGLVLSDIVFAFDAKSKLFFNKLSCVFPAGTITFLQGKNGVGKSTLFRLIRGITYPGQVFSGTYTLNKTVFTVTNGTLAQKYQQQVKMVMQDVDEMLALDCTVLQNIQLANLSCFPSFSALPVYKESDRQLLPLDISLDMPACQLSGGQRQLLAITMVLQTHTKVLLLDEPTAALDDKNAQIVMQYITKIARECNLVVIIISHDAQLAAAHADAQVLVLKDTILGKNIV